MLGDMNRLVPTPVRVGFNHYKFLPALCLCHFELSSKRITPPLYRRGWRRRLSSFADIRNDRLCHRAASGDFVRWQRVARNVVKNLIRRVEPLMSDIAVNDALMLPKAPMEELLVLLSLQERLSPISEE
jgi:hypothetical protein